MITVNELFSGIGSQRKALERLGIPHKVIGISEIDKYAIKAYESIFGETRNYGDISKISKLDYADFWTYSFPCSDVSVAGKQAGINEDTRSGLLYQVERLLNVAKEHDELPKFLMLENVKNLVGKKFKKQFDEWLEYLDELGYTNYWQVLNAKNYGIPQNRERVFVISIRKDIDNGTFQFPEPFDNGVRLKDLLETEVDEKFYISEDKVSRFISALNDKNALLYDCCQMKREGKAREYNEYSPTLTSRDYKDPRIVNVEVVGKLNSSQDGVVVSPDGIAPTHTAGHGNCPKIFEDNRVKQIGNIRDSGNWDNPQTGRVYDPCGCSPTLSTMQGGDRQPKILQKGRGFNKGGIHDVSPTISSHSWECNNFLVENGAVETEQQVLRPERTEYGKQIRKAYESGEIQESRHNMTVLKPRKDGISNTLTTVQKDNLLLEKQTVFYDDMNSEAKPDQSCGEPKVLCPQRQYDDNGVRSVKHSVSDVVPTILATQHKSGDNQCKIYQNFRIRKLTPKECWNLMGFDNEDFNTAKSAGISDSQLYKQAGNSIVVDVLYHIFKNVFSEYITTQQSAVTENFTQPPMPLSSLAV